MSEVASDMNQYLTFELEGEVYALPISQVREVLDFTQVTRVPRTPDYMRGVINLRGQVVPVLDLRLKFGLSATEKTVSTCIIMIEIELEGDMAVFGALADSVREVLELSPEQIMPAPKLGTTLNTDFIQGMGKQDDDVFIIILDVDRVFSSEELSAAQDGGKLASEATAATQEEG